MAVLVCSAAKTGTLAVPWDQVARVGVLLTDRAWALTAQLPWTGRHRKAEPLTWQAVAALAVAASLTVETQVQGAGS